jgi:hypothetical protein
VICGIVLCLIIVIPTVIHGCSTKQFLTGLGIGLLGAIMPFTFAFVWKDQETTKYTLHGFEFRVTHETFSFLDKQYDLRSFVRFQVVSGRLFNRSENWRDYRIKIFENSILESPEFILRVPDIFVDDVEYHFPELSVVTATKLYCPSGA